MFELHIDRYRLADPVNALVEGQTVAFAELAGVDAAAGHLGSMQEDIDAAKGWADEAEASIVNPFFKCSDFSHVSLV